jgi:hypothetical protein
VIGALCALAYVAGCTARRRVLARSPLRLTLLLAALAALAALQSRALAGPRAGAGRVPYAVAGVVALLGAVGVNGALRCPISLRPADVAWVLPTRNGPRALVLYKLLAMFGGFLAFGLAGSCAAWAVTGHGGAGLLARALVIALAATLLRVAAYLSFVLVTRGVPRIPVAAVWVIAAGGSAVATIARAADGAGGGWGPLSDLFGRLLLPVLTPYGRWSPGATGVAALLIAGLGAVTVMAADRYHDAAARLAWEFTSLRAALRHDEWSSGPLADMAAQRLRHGVPSLAASSRFAGEAAFAWRALAHLRRTWRRDAIGVLPFAAISAGAAAWGRPAAALAPLGGAAVLSLIGAGSTGLPYEMDRSYLLTVPGRPGRQVAAIELVPFLMTGFTLAAVWLPAAVLARGAGLDYRIGGVFAAIGLAGVIVTASSAGASLARSKAVRRGLTPALAAAPVLAGALAQALADPGARGPGYPFAAVAVAGALALHTIAARAARRRLPAPR